MSGSGPPKATMPLDDDNLELDEEKSLPDRRIIKDPVHGYRVSPPPRRCPPQRATRNADNRPLVRREQSNLTLLFANSSIRMHISLITHCYSRCLPRARQGGSSSVSGTSNSSERPISYGQAHHTIDSNIAWVLTAFLVERTCSLSLLMGSPGVAHLARAMVEHLARNQPRLEITSRDIQCITLAGLCHDLGHGPFSHVFDSQFIPKARYVLTFSHHKPVLTS